MTALVVHTVTQRLVASLWEWGHTVCGEKKKKKKVSEPVVQLGDSSRHNWGSNTADMCRSVFHSSGSSTAWTAMCVCLLSTQPPVISFVYCLLGCIIPVFNPPLLRIRLMEYNVVWAWVKIFCQRKAICQTDIILRLVEGASCTDTVDNEPFPRTRRTRLDICHELSLVQREVNYHLVHIAHP